MSTATIEIILANYPTFRISASRDFQERRAGLEVLRATCYFCKNWTTVDAESYVTSAALGSTRPTSVEDSITRHHFLWIGVILEMRFDKGDYRWSLYGTMSVTGIGTIVSGDATLGHDRWIWPYIW